MKYWSHIGLISLVFSIILDIIQFAIRIFFENFIINNFLIARLLFFSEETSIFVGKVLLLIGILRHYDEHIAFGKGIHKVAKVGLVTFALRGIGYISTYFRLDTGNVLFVIIILVLPVLIVLFYTFRLQTTSSRTQYIKILLGVGFVYPLLYLSVNGVIDFLIDVVSQKILAIIFLGLHAILNIGENLIFIALILLVRSHQQHITIDSADKLLYKQHDEEEI